MREKKVLTKTQLKRALASLPDWSLSASGRTLKAKFKQPDYITGLVLIARIAVHAEILQHHPTITYSYDTVAIALTTHDCKGLTKLDTELATRISKLVS